MNTDTPTSVNQFDPTPDEMARQLREMRHFLGSLVAALAYRQLRDGPVMEGRDIHQRPQHHEGDVGIQLLLGQQRWEHSMEGRRSRAIDPRELATK